MLLGLRYRIAILGANPYILSSASHVMGKFRGNSQLAISYIKQILHCILPGYVVLGLGNDIPLLRAYPYVLGLSLQKSSQVYRNLTLEGFASCFLLVLFCFSCVPKLH